MNRMLPINGRLVSDDEGQDLLEYGLLAGLIAVAAVVGVTTVGQTMQSVFWEVIRRGF